MPGWGYSRDLPVSAIEASLPQRCSSASAPTERISSKRRYSRTARFAAGSEAEEPRAVQPILQNAMRTPNDAAQGKDIAACDLFEIGNQALAKRFPGAQLG